MSQLVSEPTRGGAPLDRLFTSRKGPLGDVGVRDHVGYSGRDIIGFSISGETRRSISKTSTLNFQRADFSLFRMLIQRAAWEIWRIQNSLRNLCHKTSCPVVVTISESICSCSQHFTVPM